MNLLTPGGGGDVENGIIIVCPQAKQRFDVKLSRDVEPIILTPGLNGLDELGDGLYGTGLETARLLMLLPDMTISL